MRIVQRPAMPQVDVRTLTGTILSRSCLVVRTAVQSNLPTMASSLSGFSGPELGVRNGALAVDDHGKGQRHEPVAQGLGKLHRAEAADQRRIVQADLCCELAYFIGLIDGDADKLQTFGAEISPAP